MNRFLYVMAVLSSLLSYAQTQEGFQNDFFEQLTTNAIILTEEGIIKDAAEVKKFVSNFKESNYIKDFNIEVNSTLEYEIGEIKNNSELFNVMFLKAKEASTEPKIEFLTIYKNSNSELDSSAIDVVRQKWMSLCNSHVANILVEQLYMAEAYYYNRGRLIQGTKALSKEYSYMNMPSYSLKLSPKHIVFVNSEVVYEIGQCSGSYPLPYMLVWKKQEDGKWQILMDSNY